MPNLDHRFTSRYRTFQEDVAERMGRADVYVSFNIAQQDIEELSVKEESE
jgi:hypothetical protein